MSLFDRIAEARIEEARRSGLFDDLPGLGEPLELEDLSRLPDDLRAAYLVLKAANVLPEESRPEAGLTLGDLLRVCGTTPGEEGPEDRRAAVLRRYRALVDERTGGRPLPGDAPRDP